MLCVCAIAGAFATGAGAADQTVMALSSPNRFSSVEVTVTRGEQVTWMNVSGSHNVHFDDDSYTMPATPTGGGWQRSRTFDTVGDFRYYCDAHGDPGGSGMSGIVHVVAAPSGPPPENPPPGGGPPEQEPGGGGSPNPPGGPAPGGQSPGGVAGALKITLKASDSTPLAGKRVRLFGTVKPALDGRKLQIQKRVRSGKFKTIATVRLHAAAGDKSTYTLKLRLAKDVVLRARVPSEDDVSRTRKLDVHGTA